MKPAWEALGAEYEGTNVVIGDADCTVESALCGAHGVRGYPTIKYYVQGEENAYQGGRDLPSLKKFVEDTLAVGCDVQTKAGCEDKEVNFIEKMTGAAKDEVQKQLARLQGMSSGSMKADLKKWIKQRVAILKQLGKDEL
jgi:protein disulfide-isomerase A6